jgi:tryptophanyl-tRNA synthetase
MDEKQTILTGIRPTGIMHIGNYAGMLLPLVKLQKSAALNGGKIFLMIADIHALTTIEDATNIKQNSLITASLALAAGVNPKNTTVFVQSHVPEHSELNVLLGMLAPISLLELNPTFKEMKEEHPKLNTIGLLNYPVLQTADILLYKTTHVPVGRDQLPHIEIAREIVRKFNYKFGETFIEPKEIIQNESKLLSLQNPAKKMSKSHGKDSYIGLLDSPGDIRKKIKRAVTDSGKEIKYDPVKKPAISNLLTIFSLTSDKSIESIEARYKNKGYAEFKKDLAENIAEFLKPFQKNYKKIDEKAVLKILEDGSKRAREISSRTLKETKQKIGLL